MWPFRRKRDADSATTDDQGAHADTDDERQVWLRPTSPIEAVTGQSVEPAPLTDGEPGRIYADELDPDWADSATPSGSESTPEADQRD